MDIEHADPLRSKTSSGDVLCLEVCGEHLSVIDVPGIFKKTTSGVTSKADIQMVDAMVQGYMENPRSVMLTVISANIDIAMQEILERAEEVDPDGQRTLGVLTKPDLVDKGAGQAVVDLIEGRRRQLSLAGTWCGTRGSRTYRTQKRTRVRLKNPSLSFVYLGKV